MADKTTILRGFNSHLFEFIDDIISVFPDNVDIKASRTSLEYTKKLNPTLIIKIWYTYIYLPYAAVIDAGDLEFFVNKDYSNDLTRTGNPDQIMSSIDRLRGPVKQMNPTDQQKTMKYIQNLSKIEAMVPQ